VGHPDAKLILFKTCALAKILEKGTESVKAWGESLDFLSWYGKVHLPDADSDGWWSQVFLGLTSGFLKIGVSPNHPSHYRPF